jgi:hypothetical protein
MSHSQLLTDPDLELINMKSLNFAKPKLFLKILDATRLPPFNFSQILDTKNAIEPNYVSLLDKHEEPFKSISKTTTDASLLIISSSIEDFQDVIKALPQSSEIKMPG